MIETLIIYAAGSLPSIIICFVGIATFKYGMQRFGKLLNIKLWLVFVVLWLSGIFTGFLFGTVVEQYIPIISLPIFLIGVLFWLISLVFAFAKKRVATVKRNDKNI